MTPSTFWLRLRLNVMRVVRRSLVLVGIGLLLVLPFVLLGAMVWDPGWMGVAYRTFALWAMAAGPLAVLAFALVLACARSFRRSPNEKLAPRQVTFFPAVVLVQPKRGEQFETNWTWIQRATASEDALDLVISDSLDLHLFVDRTKVGDHSFATLRDWLHEHGRLEARAS
jgi:hypothetical protein